MGSHQQFCLRWNNHQSNLLNVFEELLEQETLVDVTLACEGLSLKAHKVVLSACSPYFQSLFASNPCKHPIVILKDVKYADLKSVVDFMYRGEINVVHDQLDALLKVADTLQVKGLAEVTESFCLSRERNSASKTSTGNGAAVADRNTVHRTSKSTATTRSSQPPPSPPAVKRRKKSHKGASCGVGTSAAAVATVEEADATIMPETEAFPLLVKEENVCGLYRSRSCSNSGGGGGGGEDEVVGNHLMASTSQPVDNVQSELSMVAGAALQACEANAAVSNEAVLNATYREHLSIEMAAAAASSSSADASNLPADMLDEEVDDSVYYPSTSMSALDASMSGDASLGAINSPCAPAKVNPFSRLSLLTQPLLSTDFRNQVDGFPTSVWANHFQPIPSEDLEEDKPAQHKQQLQLPHRPDRSDPNYMNYMRELSRLRMARLRQERREGRRSPPKRRPPKSK